MMNHNPEALHRSLYASASRTLSYGQNKDDPAWRSRVLDKLKELTGLPEKPSTPPEVRIEWRKAQKEFDETRFCFESEPGYWVPCHLLVPSGAVRPPVVICLQGHSSGMHISLGRPKSDIDREHIAGGRDFGLQAIKEGYAALVLEQRAFGECHGFDPINEEAVGAGRCHVAAMQAMLIGRTLLGERVLDVQRAIDALEQFPEVDAQRIACMGNSGGGTATYYAACLEPRIQIAMPSCSVCSYEGSIYAMYHCQCNFIPHALKYFAMQDLAVLIAPRKLVVVAGRQDDIFPLAPTLRTFETIEQIYSRAGCPQNCRFVTGDGGHRFYPDEAWPVFRALAQWD